METVLQDPRLEAFVQMLAHVREPVLLVSRTGKIVIGNVAAAEALATSVAALGGTELDAFAPEPLGERLTRSAHGNGSFPLRARDGRRVVGDASQLAPDLFVVRLTGSPETAQRAGAFFDMYSRVHRIAASGGHGIDELSRTLLALGMTAVNAQAGGVYLLDPTGEVLELTGAIGYSTDADDRYRLVRIDSPIPLTESVRTATAVFIETAADYAARFREFADTHPRVAAHAMACIPLEVDGRCIGAIALGFPLPWRFSHEDRAFFQRFGLESARALERVRADGDGRDLPAAERVASRFQRLHALTGVLAQAITPADVAEAAVDAGMAAVGARSAGLWLRADDGNAVTLVRAVGPTGPLPESHVLVPLDQPSRLPILDAIRDGSPVWIESCSHLAEHYPDAFRAFSRGGESALACVPLLAQGRCIGGLAYNYDGKHHFLEDERAFFQVLSWYVAQALERARLYAAERVARAAAEDGQRRSAFLADSDTMLGSLDYKETLAAVAATAVPRIADWCIIELEEDRQRGMPAVGAHKDPAKLPFVLALSRRFREQGDAHGIPAVIRTGKPLLYAKVSAADIRGSVRDPELAELYVQSGAVSSMVVPVALRGRTLGAILLNSADPARTYNEQDLAMAEELGRKVALAIENARLYRDVTEADRLKDEFLAMLSHELRNPLVPIIAAVDLMRLADDTAFSHERGLIERNVRHLVRLIDDLLDVSRIMRGKIHLDKRRVETADAVGDAVDIAYPHIEERGHRLLVSAPPRGLAILADRVRVAQSVANLLINAAKYTEPGGTITVTAEPDAKEAVIRVHDTGVGIAPDLLPRVFDLFVQSADALKRTQGGLGVGLTIVNNLIGLHGGTVAARSDGPGKGSEFAIRLPLATTSTPAPLTPPRGTRPPMPTQRVLVVDDNREAAMMLARLLEVSGCTTLIAHDGASALAAAPDFDPELALLDLGLPTMDGYELAQRLRALVGSIPIVAVTGLGQDSDRMRSRAAGFDEHLVKPIDLATIRRVVASFRG